VATCETRADQRGGTCIRGRACTRGGGALVAACVRQRPPAAPSRASRSWLLPLMSGTPSGPLRALAGPQNRASGSARTGRSLPRGEAAVRPCSIPAWLSAAFTRKERRPQTGQLLAAALNRISPANARDACSDAPVSKRPNRHAVTGRAADLLSQRLGRHRLLVISARTTNIGAPSAIRQNPRVAGHPPARLRKAPDRD
jgi:hypothetical protein